MVMFQFVAVFAATLFTGAAAYINVAEDPARMECGTVLASTVFGPSHRRAALMQVLLAVIATIAGVGAWFAGGGPNWLVGSLLIFAIVPFTLVVIRPTNNQLLNPTIDRTSDRTRHLLLRWGWLHGVRTILALASSILFLSSLWL